MSTTPESEVFDAFEANLSQIEQALHDPYITDVINHAQEFNDLLRTEETTTDEARDIIQTLDLMWGPLGDSPMLVTGNVTFLSPEGELKTTFYEDVEMISQGFVISGSPDEEESVVGRQIRLSFLMDIPASLRDEYAEVTTGTRLLGQAELDQVELVARGYSFMRAKAWLTEFHPDLIDAVDEVLLNIDPHLESEDALLGMQEFVFPPQLDDNQGDRATTFGCLSVYLSYMLNLEEKLPYVTRICGRVMIGDVKGDVVYAHLSTRSRMIFVHDVAVFETSDLHSDTGEASDPVVQIYLDATIVNGDPDGQDLRAYVPIDSLNGFESVRHII